MLCCSNLQHKSSKKMGVACRLVSSHVFVRTKSERSDWSRLDSGVTKRGANRSDVENPLITAWCQTDSLQSGLAQKKTHSNYVISHASWIRASVWMCHRSVLKVMRECHTTTKLYTQQYRPTALHRGEDDERVFMEAWSLAAVITDDWVE